MPPQDLKNSILQLAIQRKLVEQRPEEGNAHDLYNQIQAARKAETRRGGVGKGVPRHASTNPAPINDV